MSINRKFFFDQVKQRLFGGKLQQSQVDGMTAILDYWEEKFSEQDDRWLAYMLATTFHETAQTMQPIAEYGKGKGRKYGIADPLTKQVYYGRGFVQLTWKANYKAMSAVVTRDLVVNPDLAMQTDIATKIMFFGMTQGTFTGKKLADYFNSKKEDWVNARRIINGMDRAQLIADYGKKFYSAISY